MLSKIFGFRQKIKPQPQIQSVMLTIENLRQPNFSPEEFLRSETAARLGIKNIPNLSQIAAGVCLARKMQELSDRISEKLGYRIIISVNSGFRCYELNRAVGGAPNSWHIQFLACDFNIKGFEPHEAVALIKSCGVSVDKVFVERGCVHLQTCMNDAKNRNLFATAFKNENGDWIVVDGIRKV
jgi:zinc D-Ala-D-Ala carboxypeptidase